MKQLVAIILFVFSAGYSGAQTVFISSGIAINGFDPVAYFLSHAPVEGSKEFSYSWQGADWHFSNKENLDAFKANPDKYMPQFGGYCAYGASENHKAPTDPNVFTIIDGKLYLNYNLNVKELWKKDTKGNIGKAEANWVTLKDTKY